MLSRPACRHGQLRFAPRTTQAYPCTPFALLPFTAGADAPISRRRATCQRQAALHRAAPQPEGQPRRQRQSGSPTYSQGVCRLARQQQRAALLGAHQQQPVAGGPSLRQPLFIVPGAGIAAAVGLGDPTRGWGPGQRCRDQLLACPVHQLLRAETREAGAACRCFCCHTLGALPARPPSTPHTSLPPRVQRSRS